MKNNLTLITILICVCSIFFPLQAQNPTYEARITNVERTALNKLEFDIYIKRTGILTFEAFNLQHCLVFDDEILNGGIPSITYIPGTSEMNPTQVPSDVISISSVIGNKRFIKIPGRTASGPGFGTIISNIGNGTRFGRFRLTTSAPIFSHWISLNWNFNPSIYAYTTKYSAYVNGFPKEITLPSNHFSDLSDICLSCYYEYEARLMNDLLVNPNTYEFDIYFKNTTPWNTIIINGLQICLIFNDSISNGGILNTNYIAGTSEMTAAQIPDNPDCSNVLNGKRVWKLAAKKPGISASTILSGLGNGTRLGRFRITTSSPSFSSVKPNISWNFDSTYGYRTIVEIYQYSFDFTQPWVHFNNLTNPILPVELVSFQAAVKNENSIILEWSTASETNNFGFEVQRKVFSQQSAVSNNDWERIGFVEGSGNSSAAKHYSFVDNQLSGGNKFAYRLKQIDHDGTISYSSIQEVELTLSKYELTQNYPNPFNPATTIEYSLPQAGDVSLTLYNLLGEKVEEIVNEYKESGIYKVDLDANNLTSGVYIYVLRANGNTISKKMSILR